jgi:integrase
VRDGLGDKVPEVTTPDGTRDEKIDEDTAEAILEYFEQFRYACRQHVEMALCWETAMRAGAMRSIDVSDCHLDSDAPYIELVHRPDQGTPLKNKEKSERRVNLPADVSEVIRDYIEYNRPDVTDEYGREPLLATNHGRVTYNSIRRDFRGITRPCVYANECPHDRDPDECPGAGGKRNADECPSTVSCHPVRRGSIPRRHLDRDIPEGVISSRCDVSKDIMSRHYDRQDEETKARIRREHLDL